MTEKMIGRVDKVQPMPAKNGRTFMIISVNGEKITTFDFVDYIKDNITEGDYIEYSPPVKRGENLNFRDIKKIGKIGAEDNESNPDAKEKTACKDIDLETTLEECFGVAIRVLDNVTKKHKIEVLKYPSSTDIVNMALNLFDKEVSRNG